LRRLLDFGEKPTIRTAIVQSKRALWSKTRGPVQLRRRAEIFRNVFAAPIIISTTTLFFITRFAIFSIFAVFLFLAQRVRTIAIILWTSRDAARRNRVGWNRFRSGFWDEIGRKGSVCSN
jgi:hypothetical protein